MCELKEINTQLDLDLEDWLLFSLASTRTVLFSLFFLPLYLISYNSRFMATNSPPPAERANEIIEKLPSSPNLITKTGTALLGTGLIAAALSQELYVVNEESIVLIASLIVFTYIGKVIIYVLNDIYIYISLTSFSSPYFLPW
jgi:Mitochondrial ATP synthase B chain precursor (ATP-synt_B)